MFLLPLCSSATAAKKKDAASIFSSKVAASEKSNESGEYHLGVCVFENTPDWNRWGATASDDHACAIVVSEEQETGFS